MENPDTALVLGNDSPAIPTTRSDRSELARILEAKRRELGIQGDKSGVLSSAELLATANHALADAQKRLLERKPTDPQPITDEQVKELEQRREFYAKKNLADTKERVLGDLLKRVGKRYETASFDGYEQRNPRQQKVVASLQGYASNFSANLLDGRGVVLFGPAGTGKDHLLVALAREVINQHLEVHLLEESHAWKSWDVYSVSKLTIRWVNGLDLYGDLRDGMNNDGFDEKEYLAGYISPTILILSDPIPPRGVITDYQAGMLFRIIDGRYRECKPTWTTLNISSTKEADERLTPQIVDRLRDGALAMHCGWESHRKAQR